MEISRERVVKDLRDSLGCRLGAAVVEQVLSNRDDKMLRVMTEPDGRQFVSRTYEPMADCEYEQADMTFIETFKAMIAMYEQAGIDVVESTIVPAELAGGRTTVLSEYVPDIIPLKSAPLEARQEAARGLAKLLDPSIRFLPAAEALVSDMFMARQGDDGAWHPIVVDVDPRIQRKKSLSILKDMETGTYLHMSQSVIAKGIARNEEEVARLTRAFLGSLNPDALKGGHATMNALMEMHALTLNLD